MIYLVRNGPEILVVTFMGELGGAESTLLGWGEYFGDNPGEIARLGENCRIAVAVLKRDGVERYRIYTSERSTQDLLCRFINEGTSPLAADFRVEPGYVLMRLIGDISSAIESMRDEFEGEIVDKTPLFSRGAEDEYTTTIYFTQEPLNRPVPYEAMHGKALVVRGYSKVGITALLRMKSSEYLGASMGTPDWNLVEIHIGDREGRFSLHRKRIWTAVQGLQLGTITEEGWKSEYTLMGRTAGVYIMRMITPLSAESVKEFLLGLEYGETGERVADLDLFFGGVKISWKDLRADGMSNRERGIAARGRMLENLDVYSFAALQKLDAELDRKP